MKVNLFVFGLGLFLLILLSISIFSFSARAGEKMSLGQNRIMQVVAAQSPVVYLPAINRAPPTATPTATPVAVTPEPIVELFFSVGQGFSDVIPHQVIRTNTDAIYIFAPRPDSTLINVYKAIGLPTKTSDLALAAQITVPSVPLSLDAAYDGGNIVHVLINTRAGEIRDYPFNLQTNQPGSSILLASNGGTVSGDFIGTSGLSSMVDLSGALHISYWTNNNHIIHALYTYNSVSNTLTPISGMFQVDSSGSANHPVVAVSPLDNSLTIAWVSQATNPAKILARTRSNAGVWGSIQTVSTAPVWTSTNSGINIDQGPGLLISQDGKKHLTYIQNYDETRDYGRIHYAVGDNAGWIDQALNAYSHDPALAINALGDLFIIGHGHPLNQTCLSMADMCTIRKKINGTWESPKVFAVHHSTISFDASPSVKWSIVGFNRPELIEFIFFTTPYSNPTLYYGRFTTR